jgi:hypothetical protein
MSSGVYMGNIVNSAGDKLWPEPLYTACWAIARHVKQTAETEWDFSDVFATPPSPGFQYKVREYLHDLTDLASPDVGWKLPETTLCAPWITQMFPQAYYIFIVRSPLDSVCTPHLTDDLDLFGVPAPATDHAHVKRAVSWKYQYNLIRQMPKPDNWLTVRYEDLVQKHERTMRRVERFLDRPVARAVTRTDAVGRWRRDGVDPAPLAFVREPMADAGYKGPW